MSVVTGGAISAKMATAASRLMDRMMTSSSTTDADAATTNVHFHSAALTDMLSAAMAFRRTRRSSAAMLASWNGTPQVGGPEYDGPRTRESRRPSGKNASRSANSMGYRAV